MENTKRLNPLELFFQSSSDASNLECSEQEELENRFSEWWKNRKPSFEEAARPLMKYLGHNHHPHTSAYIRNNLAELLEGQEVFGIDDYILD
jgi:hypothetical protein